jgi:hypothetical protein
MYTVNMKNKNYLFAGLIILLILGLIIWAKVASSHWGAVTLTTPTSLPGIQTGIAPWVAEISNLRERLKDIKLPALAEEGAALHIHQHLDIYINGKPTPIPAGIGINEEAGFISPIHVHDDTGIVHVESPTVQTFTLGQFFDIWGVKFTQDSIGGYSSQADKILKLFLNGKLYSGDPRMLALDSHQEIVIAYGTDKELPNPIPANYIFPAGY